MFSNQFYHQTLRRYVVAFGNMFDDIVVRRLNASNEIIQSIMVPIAYGPKQKWLVRIRQNPELKAQVALQLPRLGFEITGMNYDGARRLTGTTKNVALRASDKNKLDRQYVPVPWDISFALYAYVKNSDDGAQIVEQIVPFFGPEWTNTVNVVPSMGIKMDVPTILQGLTVDDVYEGDYDSRQTLVYTFNFTMKGWFFGPIRAQGVIKRAQTDLHVVEPVANSDVLYGIQYQKFTSEELDEAAVSSRLRVQPGLLANGVGTTNSAASVSYRTISSNTAWKYAPNTFFFTDGRKYDPATGQDTY
jgi:hypothetical protein